MEFVFEKLLDFTTLKWFSKIYIGGILAFVFILGAKIVKPRKK